MDNLKSSATDSRYTHNVQQENINKRNNKYLIPPGDISYDAMEPNTGNLPTAISISILS